MLKATRIFAVTLQRWDSWILLVERVCKIQVFYILSLTGKILIIWMILIAMYYLDGMTYKFIHMKQVSLNTRDLFCLSTRQKIHTVWFLNIDLKALQKVIFTNKSNVSEHRRNFWINMPYCQFLFFWLLGTTVTNRHRCYNERKCFLLYSQDHLTTLCCARIEFA